MTTAKHIASILAMAGLLCQATASAQVYKWKDEKGVTHFSDTPPAGAKPTQPVEVKTYQTATAAPVLPAELQAVVRTNPVTLYSTSQCDACNQGRAQLLRRGIPYNEKTVVTAADMEVLARAGSVGRLPLLVIGSNRQIGYDQVTWDEALTAAGYPEQSRLPSNYTAAAPAPAAPPPNPVAPPQAGAPGAQSRPEARPAARPPPANAAPEFQF